MDLSLGSVNKMSDVLGRLHQPPLPLPKNIFIEFFTPSKSSQNVTLISKIYPGYFRID